MKKCSIFVLLIFIGICNTLLAQTVTPRKDYYWDKGWTDYYSILPDGKKHDKYSRYDERDKLKWVITYDKGVPTYVTSYYLDGKTTKYKGKVINGIITDFTGYDTNGNVVKRYVIQDGFLKSYFDVNDDWKYTLHSNGTKADIYGGGNDPTEYTYDYARQILTVRASFNYKLKKPNSGYDNHIDADVYVKNDTVFYHLTRDLEMSIDGSKYKLKKGTRGEFKFENQFNMNANNFYDRFISFANVDLDQRIKYLNYFKEPWFWDFYDITFPEQYIRDNFATSCTEMTVNYQQNKYELSLKSGDGMNGIYRYDNYDNYFKVEIVNGKVDKFVLYNDYKGKLDSALVVETVYDKDKHLHLKMLDGVRSYRIKENYEHKGHVTFTGKFIDERFVEGTKKEIRFSKKNNSSKQSSEETIHSKGKFENDLLIEGIQTISIDGAKQVYKGNFKDGVLIDGNVSCYGTFIMTWWKTLESVTATYTIANNNIHMTLKNGDVFEGKLPNAVLRMNYGNRIIFANDSVKDVTGKYIMANGNVFVGKFDRYFTLVKGDADVATTVGRYIGKCAYIRTKKGYYHMAVGEGKLILSNGNEVSGIFSQNELSTKLVSTVIYKATTGECYQGAMREKKVNGYGKLSFPNGDYYAGEFVNGKFSGTGDVRYTHKNGVYEGKVIDYQCQYVTPQDKKTLKKVAAPKIPKIVLPTNAGEMK